MKLWENNQKPGRTLIRREEMAEGTRKKTKNMNRPTRLPTMIVEVLHMGGTGDDEKTHDDRIKNDGAIERHFTLHFY
jgi:hypothetical protein